MTRTPFTQEAKASVLAQHHDDGVRDNCMREIDASASSGKCDFGDPRKNVWVRTQRSAIGASMSAFGKLVGRDPEAVACDAVCQQIFLYNIDEGHAFFALPLLKRAAEGFQAQNAEAQNLYYQAKGYSQLYGSLAARTAAEMHLKEDVRKRISLALTESNEAKGESFDALVLIDHRFKVCQGLVASLRAPPAHERRFGQELASMLRDGFPALALRIARRIADATNALTSHPPLASVFAPK